MELQYELTIDDVMAFQRRHIGRLYRVAGFAVAALVGLLSLLTFAISYSAKQAHGPASGSFLPYLAATVFFVALAVIIVFALRANHMACVRRTLESGHGSTRFGTHTVTIEEGWLIERTALSETRRRWQAVHSIEDTEEYVAVCEGPIALPMMYAPTAVPLIIPKRAFRDEQQMRAFLDEVARLRAAAQAQSQV